MKKLVIVLLFLMIGCSVCQAQKKWKPRVALNGSFYSYSGEGWADVIEYNTYSAEVGVLFKERFLLGVGVGYSKVLCTGEPFDLEEHYIPLYADLKYYQPVFKWLEVFGGIEIGGAKRVVEKMYQHRKYPTHFMCYPQLGLYAKIYKTLGVEVSFGCRNVGKGVFWDPNFWCPNFSIVF